MPTKALANGSLDLSQHAVGHFVKSALLLTLVAESDDLTLLAIGSSYTILSAVHPTFGSLITVSSSTDLNIIFCANQLDLGSYR